MFRLLRNNQDVFLQYQLKKSTFSHFDIILIVSYSVFEKRGGVRGCSQRKKKERRAKNALSAHLRGLFAATQVSYND